MELKEYIAVFKKHFGTFLLVIILVIAAAIIFQLVRPLNYKASLTLNVTRGGSQKTEDYKYDEFYRLQADERFADTVVRWLGAPRITADIYEKAGVGGDRRLKARRLSSQIIEVIYIAPSVKSAQDLAGSIIEILNRETERLNKYQEDEAWFKILGSQPVIAENKFDWRKLVAISLLAGIFLGSWAALIKHYLE
jgi:uncharacterized protein involved in exopolysaccharide biosynthesis